MTNKDEWQKPTLAPLQVASGALSGLGAFADDCGASPSPI